jgi:hypothetical protein
MVDTQKIKTNDLKYTVTESNYKGRKRGKREQETYITTRKK